MIRDNDGIAPVARDNYFEKYQRIEFGAAGRDFDVPELERPNVDGSPDVGLLVLAGDFCLANCYPS